MTFDYDTEPKDTIHFCNLCGWGDFKPYANQDRYGLLVHSVQCAGCGLVFLNPRMTAAAYREFYRSGAYRELLSEFYGRPVTAESIEAEQEVYAERLANVLEPHMDGRTAYHLLDAGGSTGVVAKKLARRFELAGTVIEPSEAEARRAEARGLTVFNGTLDDFVPNGLRYELVTMCQTIDHVLDVGATLLKLKCLMSPGGLLFLDLVDYRVTEAKKGREGTIKVDHPFYLEPGTMAPYLSRAGLKVLWSAPSEDGLHVDYVCEAA